MNFKMFKLLLAKAEEPEVKFPTSFTRRTWGAGMMTIKANRGDTGLARMAETREPERQDESRAEVPGLERGGAHAGQGRG